MVPLAAIRSARPARAARQRDPGGEPDVVAPRLLHAVQRPVRRPDELRDVRPVGSGRRSHTDGHVQRPAVDDHRDDADRPDDPLAARERVLGVRAREQGDELVAAEAAEQVGVPQHPRQR